MLNAKRKLSNVARKQKENSDIVAATVAAERARAGHLHNTILNKEALVQDLALDISAARQRIEDIITTAVSKVETFATTLITTTALIRQP